MKLEDIPTLKITTRGDKLIEVWLAGRRETLFAMCSNRKSRGFSLIELVITITVMTILTLAAVPLVQVAVKRQKEQQLREALRTMREAIDQFHREAVRSPCGAQLGATPGQPQPQQQQQVSIDPRVKVVISDCTIFGVDNPDRYPPDLDILVNGVDVMPYGAAGLGQRGNLSVTALDAAKSDALATKRKSYLRAIPIDPMTGRADWGFRSSYDGPDSASWGEENLFDVYSTSKGTALNGEKYSDW